MLALSKCYIKGLGKIATGDNNPTLGVWDAKEGWLEWSSHCRGSAQLLAASGEGAEGGRVSMTSIKKYQFCQIGGCIKTLKCFVYDEIPWLDLVGRIQIEIDLRSRSRAGIEQINKKICAHIARDWGRRPLVIRSCKWSSSQMAIRRRPRRKPFSCVGCYLKSWKLKKKHLKIRLEKKTRNEIAI